jgi:hypothetical protein
MSSPHDAFDEIVADVPVYGDLDRAIERAHREQRRRNRAIAGLATAAVMAVIVSLLANNNAGNRSQQPIDPATTPPPTPTEHTSTAAWEPPEHLRRAASRVVRHDQDNFGNALDWRDPRDAAVAEADIVSVAEAFDMRGGSSWQFQLAARPPLDPAGRVIAYGVVVDRDGDRRADCQIGINNDAPGRGAYHVWVTNLRTHKTAVQDGPPYGMPVEFAHPAERLEPDDPVMYFGFLRGLTHPAPCDPFGDSSIFYAWSSVTEAGEVIARDYAPDAAWLPISFETNHP